MEVYYAPVNFYFKLLVPGVNSDVDYAFQEVSGLTVEMPYEEIKENGENRFKYKVPTETKYNNLVLKRGIVKSDSKVVQWCKDTILNDLSAKIETKNITVLLVDTNGKPKMSWLFSNAWPVKWNCSDLESTKGEILIESIEFAYNSFKLI